MPTGPPTSQFVVPSPIFTSNGNGSLIMTSNPAINNPTVHTCNFHFLTFFSLFLVSGLYTAQSQGTFVIPQRSPPTSPQHSPYSHSPQSAPLSPQETPTSPNYTYLPTTVHTQTTTGQTVLIPINQFTGTTSKLLLLCYSNF
jgi:hypothetical protein